MQDAHRSVPPCPHPHRLPHSHSLPRHRADYCEEFPSSPRGPGPVGHYLVEHNHIYGAAAGHHRPDEYDPGLPSRPVSRALAACTLRRQPQAGPRHQGLARQRSVSNLGKEGRGSMVGGC